MKSHLVATLFVAVPVWGCRDAVDLGNEVAYWFPGQAAAGGSTTEPITLYEGNTFPSTYAVDDTTFLTAFAEPDVQRGTILGTIKSCELASCASTLRIVHQQGYPEAGFMPLQVLALSGAEFFFQYRDSLGALYVVACPRTGCTNAPRQVAAGRASHLLATDDDVYWDDGTNIMRCAREGCPAPSSRNLQVIARSATQDASELTSFCIVGDFIYVVGQGGVARLERKLESDPDWIYVSNAPVKGIAAHGGWVYFAISTLTGEVRRCPITGCVGDPEVVTSGQRWPSWLAVDERSLYWFNFHPEPGNTPAVSLRSATLGDSAEPRILVSNVPLLNYIPIFMNAHHFYWAERLEVRARIRSLAK